MQQIEFIERCRKAIAVGKDRAGVTEEFAKLYVEHLAPSWADGMNTDVADAAKWRALVNCARMRVTGSAGFGLPPGEFKGQLPGPDGYRHIGLEIWTQYNLRPSSDCELAAKERAAAIAMLDEFVKIVTAKGTAA